MDKTRNNELLKLADEALREQVVSTSTGVSKILKNNGEIDKAYNGSIAAFGVSVAMSGLLPTLAIFYQEKQDSATRPQANRRSVLDAIARIVTKDSAVDFDFSNDGKYAENMFRHAIENDGDLTALKTEVIECAIALKQIVRTYDLV